MAINSATIATIATLLQSNMVWMQLHSAAAGDDATDNIATTMRCLIYWTAAVDGEFGLAGPLRFINGEPGSTVYSATLWDQETDGTCYGEYPLTNGDTLFNVQGEFLVTALDFVITATDS